MRLNEINFSFNGLHCLRDFGCFYVEKSGHPAAPAKTPNEYEIAGLSGTVRMEGQTYDPLKFSGSLYFTTDPPTQAAAQEMLRKISAWLLDGRRRLIFDYEPTRFYLAEVTASSKWSYADWMEGGLDIEFEAQPFAYNVDENTVSKATTAASNTLTLIATTGEPAPLKVTVKNTGTAAITGVTVTVGAASQSAIEPSAVSGAPETLNPYGIQTSGVKKAELTKALNIAAGGSLTIDMEPPIGAVYGNGDSALPCAKRFDYIALPDGPNTINVALAYGSGTAGAAITASVRGRYK